MILIYKRSLTCAPLMFTVTFLVSNMRIIFTLHSLIHYDSEYPVNTKLSSKN